MADQSTTALAATPREPSNSREARRLRRAGFVPGIVYGGGQDPVAFQIDAIALRNTLAHASTVLDLTLDGGASSPVVLKEQVLHPVTGATTHIDLLRVNLNEKIQAPVSVELTGAEDTPGVKTGGILEHVLREVTVEALPNEIPDSLTLDVSQLELGDTLTLSALSAPAGVEIIGDPEATVATVTASRAARAADEEGEDIETETELVGEESAEGEADAEASADADAE